MRKIVESLKREKPVAKNKLLGNSVIEPIK